MYPLGRRAHEAAGRLKPILRSRLFWELAASLMLVLFVVNAVILLPEYRASEERALRRLHHEAGTIVRALDRLASANVAPRDFATLAEQVIPDTSLKGGAIYNANGAFVHAFGEMPTLKPAEPGAVQGPRRQRRTVGNRHDIVWRLTDQGKPYFVVVRTDASVIGVTRSAVFYQILAGAAASALLAALAVLALMGRTLLGPLYRIHQAVSRRDATLIGSTMLAEPGEIGDIARSVRTYIAANEQGVRPDPAVRESDVEMRAKTSSPER